MNSFEDFDITIYKDCARQYLPYHIKYLFIAESPPAFDGDEPTAYFYFDECKKADLLFYTLIKATLGVDFIKETHDRSKTLYNFMDKGCFLIDAVSFPINKNQKLEKIRNEEREQIIQGNLSDLGIKITSLDTLGFLNSQSKIILLKETVFNICRYLDDRIVNDEFIPFPRYVKDKDVVEKIRKLIG